MPIGGEVWFRVVHDATALPSPVTAGVRIAQPIGVTIGPVVAFRPDMTVSLSRQVPAMRVIHPVLPGRGISQKTTAAQKAPRPLPVAETIKRARAWDELLKSGQVKNRAEIARREGLSRARVTQIMMLLRVPDNVLDRVLATQTKQRGLLGELDLRRLSASKYRENRCATAQTMVSGS